MKNCIATRFVVAQNKRSNLGLWFPLSCTGKILLFVFYCSTYKLCMICLGHPVCIHSNINLRPFISRSYLSLLGSHCVSYVTTYTIAVRKCFENSWHNMIPMTQLITWITKVKGHLIAWQFNSTVCFIIHFIKLSNETICSFNLFILDIERFH